MTKNSAASVILGCVSWMIQNRSDVGTNDMVACRTIPSSRANPLTASSACSLSGAGEPSPDFAITSSDAAESQIANDPHHVGTDSRVPMGSRVLLERSDGRGGLQPRVAWPGNLRRYAQAMP